MPGPQRSLTRSPLVGVILTLCGLALAETTVHAQSLTFEQHGNDSTASPGTHLDVTGFYSFSSGQADNIRLRMWEVDSNDNTVGNPKEDKSLNNLTAGMMKA